MKNYFGNGLAALSFVGAVALAAPADAATITLNPSASVINVGDTVFIDIVVGLGASENVGGAQLGLAFNGAIVTGQSSVEDPGAAMQLVQCQTEYDADQANEPACVFDPVTFDPVSDPDLAGVFGAGGSSPYSLNFLANDELDGDDLKGLQGNSFILATLSFLGAAPGTSLLTFFDFVLSDYDGNVLATTATGGSITVNDLTGPQPVPEPGTIALLGAGAAVLLARRVRRNRN